MQIEPAGFHLCYQYNKYKNKKNTHFTSAVCVGAAYVASTSPL